MTQNSAQNTVNELLELAAKLTAEGITPGVATLKTHLQKPVSLPLIIEAVKLWKSLDKEAVKQAVNSVLNTDKQNNLHPVSDSQESQTSVEISELKNEIADLRNEIKLLRREISKLTTTLGNL